MLCKNPEENEQRRYRYHTAPLSAVSENEIEQYCVKNYYQQINESEWRQEYIPKVKAALKRLSRKQSQVIELYIFRKMEQAEISRLMCCSQQAVSRLYVRAIKQIREYIAK